MDRFWVAGREREGAGAKNERGPVVNVGNFGFGGWSKHVDVAETGGIGQIERSSQSEGGRGGE